MLHSVDDAKPDCFDSYDVILLVQNIQFEKLVPEPSVGIRRTRVSFNLIKCHSKD